MASNQVSECARSFYGRRFVEAFLEAAGNLNVTTAIDSVSADLAKEYGRLAGEEYKSRLTSVPPVDSFSLEMDINNFEQRFEDSREGKNVPTGEMMSRLVSILRRINREKGWAGPPVIVPTPSPYTMPNAPTPNVGPFNPTPVYPIITCEGNTNVGRTAVGVQSFYRPENPPAFQKAVNEAQKWAESRKEVDALPSQPDATGNSISDNTADYF